MITFTPRRGQILMCNFDMGNVPPEMRKTRRVVVMSPKSFNGRHGAGPGKCVVVPFSGTTPRKLAGSHVLIPNGSYASLSIDVWAICEAVAHVSHTRLDRVAVGAGYLTQEMSPADILRIEDGLKIALGM